MLCWLTIAALYERRMLCSHSNRHFCGNSPAHHENNSAGSHNAVQPDVTQCKPVEASVTRQHRTTHQPVCLDMHSSQYLHSVTASRQEVPPENSSSLSCHATHCVEYDPNNHYNHENMLLALYTVTLWWLGCAYMQDDKYWSTCLANDATDHHIQCSVQLAFFVHLLQFNLKLWGKLK